MIKSGGGTIPVVPPLNSMEIAKLKIEDIQIGLEVERVVEISRETIANFAEMTQDFHPLHTDVEYAKNHGFNDIIAHGLLISSFSSTIIGMQLPGENALVLSQSFKFGKPVYPGDTLQYKGVVKDMDDRFNTIEVKILVKNQEGKKVGSGIYQVKIR